MRFEFQRFADLGELGEQMLYVEGDVLDEPDRQLSAVILSICILRSSVEIDVSRIVSGRVRMGLEDELIAGYRDFILSNEV